MVANGHFFGGGGAGKQYATDSPVSRVWSTYPIHFSRASPAASPAQWWRWLPLPLLSTGITAAAASVSFLVGSQSGLFSFQQIGKRVSDPLLIGQIEDQCFNREHSFAVVTPGSRDHPILNPIRASGSNQVLTKKNPDA